MIQLPLGRQLAVALANDRTRKEMLYRHHHTQKADGSISDVFDGQAYQSKKHLFSGENDIAISLSVDGFAPHSVPGSVTIVHVTNLNLPPMIRYERSRMIQVAIIPGPKAPADFWSFLEPVLKELRILQAGGMVVKTPSGDISAKVHVLMTTGDIPVLGKMACHVGHMSKDGCRICHVVGQSPGHGQYFRMSSAITMRTPESFKHFDEVASSSKKGLTGQSPFSLLDSFSGPFFFALDEMHGICHGIGKQVWGLVYGKYGKDHPLSLSLAAQKEIGTAMVSTRRSIPTSFHGAWINIATRSGYFRAVDWADFILFVIPTLVAERVRDQAARKALLDLVQTCNLLMSWELSAEEKTLIKT